MQQAPSSSSAASRFSIWQTLRHAGIFARRELRTGLQGFKVFMLCLAIGVAAIAASGAITVSVHRALTDNAQALLGGDLSLRQRYQPIPESVINTLPANSRITRIQTMRGMAKAQGNAGARYKLVELKAIDAAYPLYGELRYKRPDPNAPGQYIEETTTPTQQRALPLLQQQNDPQAPTIAGKWGIFVSPDLLASLDVQVGDTITLGRAHVQIRGIITREPDQSASLLTFGPRVMLPSAALRATGLQMPGALIDHIIKIATPPNTAAKVRADLNAAFPNANWTIQGLDRATPGVQRFLNNVAQFIGFVGLTALLIGGIGVANSVQAYMDKKIHVIATLKCLGAPAHTILWTYLIQTLVLAIIGSAIGCAIGILTPLAVQGTLSAYLPIDIPVHISPWIMAQALAFGVLTTLTFALPALAHAQRTPALALFRDIAAGAGATHPARTTKKTKRKPKNSFAMDFAIGCCGGLLALLAIETAYKPWLATFFILGCCGAIAVLYGTSYGAQAVMRWLDKALKKSRVPAVVRLAINNIHRPGAPTPAIILSLGLGLTVLVSVTQIDINLRNQLAERVPQKAPTFFFIDIQSNQIDDFRHRAQAIPGVSLLSEAAMIRGRIVKANGHPVSETTVPENIRWAVRGDRGFTEAAQQPENATLTAGTWWDADYTGAPLVSLDQNIARGLGLGVGDTITVNILGQDVTAKIANLRAINWMSMSMNFTFVFNKGGLGALPRTYIVTAKAEGTAKPALERSIAEAMPNISAIPVADALKTAEDMINTGSNAVALAALVAVISGVCVLVGAMAIGQDKRIKEAITLKVLGATPAMLWRIYILEFSVLGGLVAGIALGLGSLAAWAVITHVMHLPFHLAIVPALAVLALGLTITIALGFLGSYQALRSKPASLLKNDA